MKIIFIKVLVGILFGVAFGLISVPLSKKLILSRSEDPGDVIVLRKKSTYILTALAGAVSAVGFILTADDETVLIRNLALLLPMLAIAIVDSLIRKIPNSLLLVMIITQAAYTIMWLRPTVFIRQNRLVWIESVAIGMYRTMIFVSSAATMIWDFASHF